MGTCELLSTITSICHRAVDGKTFSETLTMPMYGSRAEAETVEAAESLVVVMTPIHVGTKRQKKLYTTVSSTHILHHEHIFLF